MSGHTTVTVVVRDGATGEEAQAWNNRRDVSALFALINGELCVVDRLAISGLKRKVLLDALVRRAAGALGYELMRTSDLSAIRDLLK